MRMPAFICLGRAMTDLGHKASIAPQKHVIRYALDQAPWSFLETSTVSQDGEGPGSITAAVSAAQQILIHFPLFSFFQLPAHNAEIKNSNRQAGTTHLKAVKRQLSTNLHSYSAQVSFTQAHVQIYLFDFPAFASAAHSCTAYCFCQKTYWHSSAPSTFLMTAFMGTVEWVLSSDSHSVDKT